MTVATRYIDENGEVVKVRFGGELIPLYLIEAFNGDLQSGQGVASPLDSMNVAGDENRDKSGAGMAHEHDEADVTATFHQSRHRMLLAFKRLVIAVQFLQEMEAIMAGAAADVIQALGTLQEHFKDDNNAVEAILTLIKSKPTEAEMQQIKTAIADMQAGVDAQTAAAKAAAGTDASGSGDTGTGSTGGDTGTSGSGDTIPVGDGTTGGTTTGGTGAPATGTTEGDATANPNVVSRRAF